MTIIHAQWVGEQAVVPKDDFERLVELARKSEVIEVHTPDDELSTQALMQLVEGGGAFDYWNEPGEDIHSSQDGKPV